MESVAAQIKALKFKDPFVIGLYGKWGMGKSSILLMLKEKIREEYGANFFSADFNPWRYQSEDLLLLDFFKALVDGVNSSHDQNEKTKKRAADLLNSLSDYSAAITAPTIAIDGGITFGTIQIIRPFLKQVSNYFKNGKSLEDHKKKVDGILSGLAVPLIVYIDDVDRLSNDEIRLLFKLIKLSANFQNVRYVLVFDEEIVAKALGSDYGGGTVEEGRAFLEKIVQMPIRIPALAPRDHMDYTLGLLQEWLDQEKVLIHTDEIPQFRSCFSGLHERFIKTPRDSKRLLNAIAFSERCLRKEVNVLDLVLLELIRLFVQPVFWKILNKPESFIPSLRNNSRAIEDILSSGNFQLTFSDEKPNPAEDFRQELRLSDDDWQPIVATLNYLFPTNAIVNTDNSRSTINDIDEYRKQKIFLPEYFIRYLRYEIDPDTIPDSEFQQFQRRFEENNYGDLDAEVEKLLQYRPRSIFKNIEVRWDSFSPQGAANFALLIGLNPQFYHEYSKGVMGMVQEKHIFMLKFQDLLEQASTVENIKNVIGTIVSECPSPQLVYEILNFLAGRINSDENETPQFLSELSEYLREQQQALVERVADMPFEDIGIGTQPILSDGLLALLYQIGQWEQVRTKAEAAFQQDPQKALAFMRGVVPPAIEGADRETYSLGNYENRFRILEKYIPRSVFREKLLILFPHYAGELPMSSEAGNLKLSTEEELAIEYLRFVKKEESPSDEHSDGNA